MSLQYNDTVSLNGVIQSEEDYCDLGVGGISGNATLLKQFTRHNNTTMSKIWSWIYKVAGGTYDDGNQTNLPSATQQLTINVANYALPTDAQTIEGIEIYNAEGLPTRLIPTSIALEQKLGALGDFGRTVGIPTKYMLEGNTIKLDYKPSATIADGFKVYFERGSVAFEADDTTKTPGFSSEFHNAVAVGGALEWLGIHKPDSTIITKLLNDWRQYELDIKEFYTTRLKDDTPRIVPQITEYR